MARIRRMRGVGGGVSSSLDAVLSRIANKHDVVGRSRLVVH